MNRSKEAHPSAGPPTPLLRLEPAVCADWESAARREWLVTNGIGGYASGSVALANTRRYHGLLIASSRPPLGRVLLLAKLDIAALYLNRRHDLFSNEFASGSGGSDARGLLSPRGFVNTLSFELVSGIPTWRHALADALIEQQIFMAPQTNTSYIALTLVRASAPVQLELTPLCAHRDHHAQQRGARPFEVAARADGCTVSLAGEPLQCALWMPEGRFDAAPDWYWRFRHRAEGERGLDTDEDLFMPGRFRATLKPQESLYFTASALPAGSLAADVPQPEHVHAAVSSRGEWLAGLAPAGSPDWIAQLAIASDQFLVQRPRPSRPLPSGAPSTGASVIAGYPWFGDWSRDTLISLPGLTLSLGRREVAADILDTLFDQLDEGLLPNRFPDDGGPPEFNTADASLWLFNAADEYLAATADTSWARRAFPLLMQVLRAHLAGARHGIGVDPADGLLRAGTPGLQLTWMDAKVGERVITPRIGKPVEINALWLNALDVCLRLSIRLRDSEAQMLCKAWLGRARNGFARFWNEAAGHLYDVLDVDGGTGQDASLRPNQILAVSLPYCALPAHQMRGVVDACARELLTPVGLRSLSAADAAYRPRYEGGVPERDGAYHQGTVWAWLLGPFALAHHRVYGDATQSQSFLQPLGLHLRDAGIGSVSEIFDAEPPHLPRGCIAQAWSVAETLRAWLKLERAKTRPTGAA